MLFRAVAYRDESRDTPPGGTWPEVHVFFEAADSDVAPAVLRRLLAAAWDTDPDHFGFHNIWSENELLRQAMCEASTGDLRLLETGFCRVPLFCMPERTLLIVTPPTLTRLVKAQERARAWCAWQAVRAELRDQAAPHMAGRKSPADKALRPPRR